MGKSMQSILGEKCYSKEVFVSLKVHWPGNTHGLRVWEKRGRREVSQQCSVKVSSSLLQGRRVLFR